jgi:GNAT superfamily N-acetyltransferase
MGERAELEAALRFLARTDDKVADELVPMSWGTGLFDPRRPLVWDANYVRGERTAGLEAGYLAGTVEPLFAERRLAHRQLVIPEETEGRALRPGFEALGWRPADEVVMASVRSPPVVKHAVEEVSFAELREPVRELELAEPPGGANPASMPALVDQLADRNEWVAAITDERRFTVREGGVPVAWCRLYAGEGIGQVEQVATHPAYRNRGYGRAVVSAAVAASRERGDELTFLVALADDWPQQLYRRLGFEAVGRLCRFRRLPDSQPRSSLPS